MRPHHDWIAVSIVLTLVLTGQWGVARASRRALVAPASDPCTTPAFVPDLAFSSNAGGRERMVAGGGTAFYLWQYPQAAPGDTGGGSTPDMPGLFVLVRGTQVFRGFVNIFEHRSYQHLCLDEPVDGATWNGHRLRDHGFVPGQLEGRLSGRWITISLIVQQHHYWVYGSLTPVTQHR